MRCDFHGVVVLDLHQVCSSSAWVHVNIGVSVHSVFLHGFNLYEIERVHFTISPNSAVAIWMSIIIDWPVANSLNTVVSKDPRREKDSDGPGKSTKAGVILNQFCIKEDRSKGYGCDSYWISADSKLRTKLIHKKLDVNWIMTAILTNGPCAKTGFSRE